MRIRCSKGVRVNSFHGHFFIQSSDLMSMPQARTRPCGISCLSALSLRRTQPHSVMAALPSFCCGTRQLINWVFLLSHGAVRLLHYACGKPARAQIADSGLSCRWTRTRALQCR